MKRKLGVKWICDLRDPWTEAYYNKDLYRKSLARYLDQRLEKEVLLNADMVTTIGPGMAKLLKSKLPATEQSKVHFIYNGYDAELFKGLEKQPGSDFTILHLGLLSENQPIYPFIAALKIVLAKVDGMSQKISILFVGKVSPSIIKEVEEALPAVNFSQVDYVPHAEAIQYMLNANLLLNSLAETSESELLISGKLMEYVATGNPVCVLGNPAGDAARLLSTVDRAEVFSRTDQTGMEKFIEMIYLKWLKGERYEKSNLSIHSRYETTRLYAILINNLG